MSRPVVLTIAGHDPSGGAGVTADLRVIESMGCVGVSAITALTVQNTVGVQSVHVTDADVLKGQLDALFSDIPISGVKIGMLGGSEQVRAVTGAIRRYEPAFVVLDPVLASTGGVPLLDDIGLRALVTDLLPLCTIVTPNLSESVRLTHLPAFDPDTMEAAGRRLVSMGARAALVKGGHLNGDPIDVLTLEDGSVHVERRARTDTPHTHGTGCFLSAGIAAGLANNRPVTVAYTDAAARLVAGLSEPVVIGKGAGSPRVFYSDGDAFSGQAHRDRRAHFSGIYAITDGLIRPERSVDEIVTAFLAGGAKIVQIRDKRLGSREIIAGCRRLSPACRERGALLIVNDSVEAVVAADADGVHLGPDDMAPRDARRALGPGRVVGVSVANVEEAREAAPYASYFGVGAVFGSKTKLDAGDAIGLDRLREIKAAFPDMPLVAIGGINRDNIAQVRETGVEAAAVISAVVGADDMEEATRELVEIWNRGR